MLKRLDMKDGFNSMDEGANDLQLNHRLTITANLMVEASRLYCLSCNQSNRPLFHLRPDSDKSQGCKQHNTTVRQAVTRLTGWKYQQDQQHGKYVKVRSFNYTVLTLLSSRAKHLGDFDVAIDKQAAAYLKKVKNMESYLHEVVDMLCGDTWWNQLKKMSVEEMQCGKRDVPQNRHSCKPNDIYHHEEYLFLTVTPQPEAIVVVSDGEQDVPEEEESELGSEEEQEAE